MDTGIEETQIPEPAVSRAIQELRQITESYYRDKAERERSEEEKRKREDRALLPDDYAVQVDVFA
ncbi:MAG: hypothetical protein PQJ58_02625 [Spirochaetales bacterium]|nr:hypothetical protein [Spirochaetales bacterium]